MTATEAFYEIDQVRKALDEAGVPTGNEHTNYTLAERVLLLVIQRDTFMRQVDELRASEISK